MSNITVQTPVSSEIIEKVLVSGDLSKLTADQRLSYIKAVCDSVGLNSLTRPFEYITLNGKLTLYAKRDATDQLRKIHNVSIKITGREVIGGVYVVTAQATMPDGRCDESTGAVNVEGLKGETLANAYLKCETKSKRRVTLSICGLGLLDETEIESIPAEAKTELPRINSVPKPTIQPNSNDPWQYRLPQSWKQNGGKSLREIGLDGIVKVIGWIQSLENPSDQLKQVYENCERALKTRTDSKSEVTDDWANAEFEDSAYEMAKAAK